MMSAFVNTDTKPRGSVDARSVKHAAVDATKKGGGGQALTVAGAAAAYDWIEGHGFLNGKVPEMPMWLWVVLMLGAGWWLMLFAVRLLEKWGDEF